MNSTYADFISTQTLEMASKNFLNAMLYQHGNVSQAMNCGFIGSYYQYLKVGWCGYVYPSLSVCILLIFFLFLLIVGMSVAGIATAYRFSKVEKLLDSEKSDEKNEEDGPINN
jgi:hypothetical protein